MTKLYIKLKKSLWNKLLELEAVKTGFGLDETKSDSRYKLLIECQLLAMEVYRLIR